MAKELVIFDSNGKESKRIEIPQVHVETNKDYNWILWKYGNLHHKDPNKYHCWQLGHEVRQADEEEPENLN